MNAAPQPQPPSRNVVVIQRRMVHYRLPFFEALRNQLAEQGCTLRLAYGEPTESERRKNDSGDIAWAERLPTRYLWGERICWQPFGHLLKDADLVVVTAENKLIYNLAAQYLQRRCRVALWGHGANLQGDPTSLRERFKRVVACRADWWFAYAELSRPLIEACGYPRERISVVNNSVDTGELAAQLAGVSPAQAAELRARLQLENRRVGLFIGSLYKEKRIDFMLEAASRIHARVPDFAFLMVGAGPQAEDARRFCAANPWAHYLGELKGQKKAEVLALADVMINPGAVGLGILDSFVSGVPLVTSDCGTHGPEICYLANGENGLMTTTDLDDYVAAVCRLLEDPAMLQRLRAASRASAQQYSVANMARHFSDGVLRCLAAPRYRG